MAAVIVLEQCDIMVEEETTLLTSKKKTCVRSYVEAKHSERRRATGSSNGVGRRWWRHSTISRSVQSTPLAGFKRGNRGQNEGYQMGCTRLPGRGGCVTETPRWGVGVMGSDSCSFIACTVESSRDCCPPWLMELAEKRWRVRSVGSVIVILLLCLYLA